ncbi:MAG: DUF4124 domain-containing protein [Gammaproteobacteria bacterium]|nr:DUF4124 domain-containing protein [Gammaproteobacteria bacterium]
MKLLLLKTIVIAGLLAVTATVSARGAYKWVDAKGIVHYSDRIDSPRAEVLRVPSEDPEQPAGEQTAKPDSRGKARSANPSAADKKPQDAKADAEQRTQKCQQAREQHEGYLSMGRMYREDANGERSYLSEEERAQVIEQSQQVVEYWCGKQ